MSKACRSEVSSVLCRRYRLAFPSPTRITSAIVLMSMRKHNVSVDFSHRTVSEDCSENTDQVSRLKRLEDCLEILLIKCVASRGLPGDNCDPLSSLKRLAPEYCNLVINLQKWQEIKLVSKIALLVCMELFVGCHRPC